MDLFSFLATVILITSIVSLVMAFAAYIAYKIRDIRKPRKNVTLNTAGKNELVFLSPVNTESLVSEWMQRGREPHLKSTEKPEAT
jgi:heme/copper-type cytochrome/quinol oxidase subunit 2